ncbi:MAG TPA: hypothetical protein VN817_06885 [Solirubrobacteraceae bacterium]|nr:hypothetical protein [Solirubrobacteraceae bacterium]
MPGNGTGDDPDADAERAVVAEAVARRDPLTRAKLVELVSERFEPDRAEAAIDALIAVAVLVAEGENVNASPALVRLDEIGLIPI